MITGSTASTNWLSVNLTGTNMVLVALLEGIVEPIQVNKRAIPICGMINLN